MSENLKMRRLRTGEHDRAAAFLSAHWRADSVLVQDEAFFQWQFAHSENETAFWIAEEAGEIAAVLGTVETQWNDHGETRPLVWLVNWLAPPGSGVGLPLQQAVRQAHPGALFAVLGVSETAEKLYRALRWCPLPPAERFAAIAPGQEATFAACLAQSALGVSTEQARETAEALHWPETAESTHSGMPDIRVGEEIDWEAWDRFHNTVLSPRYAGTSRSATWLQHRYRHHPVFAYRIVQVHGTSGAQGLAVWRPAEVTGTDGRWLGRILRLLEWMTDGPSAAAALRQELDRDLRTSGALAVEWVRGQTSPSGTGPIPDHFLHPLRNHPHLPAQWTPISMQETTIKGFTDPRTLYEGVFWTLGDGDRDRPR